MATSFEVIFLGTLARIDTTQGNEVAENAAGILGTYGSAAAPLSSNIRFLTPQRLTEDDNDSYDTDNGGGFDSFRINGGAAQNFDAVATYNAIITYADGTTSPTITVVVFQDVNGNTYLAPEETNNADQAALTAAPILSLNLQSVVANTGDMEANRVAGDFKGSVDGTSGADNMVLGYTDAQGDQITNSNDYILAGAGNDTINAANGNDTILAGDGNDLIEDWNGNDSVRGGSGNDTVNLGAGNDTILTEDGDDVVRVWDNAGTNSLDGGTGTDTLDFANWQSSTGANVDINAGGSGTFSHFSGATTGSFTGFEVVSGTAYADTLDASDSNVALTLDGEEGNDSLVGGSAADTISGGSGADTISGGAGNDSLSGGDGNDSLLGGLGNDTIFFGSGDDIAIGGDGDDLFDDDPGTPAGTGNNLIDGGAGNDFSWDGAGNDTFYGGDGNDTYIGDSGGNDLLFGDAGDDSLSGGAGNDDLSGGDGRDTLIGGEGADTLTGGAGPDVFVVDAGGDVITDFDTTTGIQGGGAPDQTDNDFVDLSAHYNETTLAAWNAANPGNTFLRPIDWLRADHADDGALAEVGGLRIEGADGNPVDANQLYFENTGVICFASGTRIATPRGEIAVENLEVGDLVITLDQGARPLVWTGATVRDWPRTPHVEKPIRLKAGCLGAGRPSRDLIVSPQHRVLLSAPQETAGILIPAKSLLGQPGVRQMEGCRSVVYHHLMLDRHHILMSNGIPTESFYPGTMALRMMAAETSFVARAVLSRVTGGAGLAGYPAARPILSMRAAQTALRTGDILFQPPGPPQAGRRARRAEVPRGRGARAPMAGDATAASA